MLSELLRGVCAGLVTGSSAAASPVTNGGAHSAVDAGGLGVERDGVELALSALQGLGAA
jgi:hypothetical protein